MTAAIRNAEALTRVFGYWPGFHDAEVVRLKLDRGGGREADPSLEADVYVFEMTSEVGPDGTYVLRHRTLVTLLFEGIDGLEMTGFNQQNVLMCLTIAESGTREESADLTCEVTFEGSWGLSGRFLCRRVTVVDVGQFGA